MILLPSQQQSDALPKSFIMSASNTAFSVGQALP
jgi:hypothetical protein